MHSAPRTRTIRANTNARLLRWLAFLVLCFGFSGAASATCTSPNAVNVTSGGTYRTTCTDFGFVSPPIQAPSHGSLTYGDSQNIDALIYTNNGDGATSDTFTVDDGDGNPTVFNVTVAPASSPLTISPATLPTPSVGVAYSQSLSTTGGTAPYTYTVASGALPPGITLSASGVISGTATGDRTYSFTVQSTDAATTPLSVTKAYSFDIAPPTLTISPTNPAGASTNVAYSQTFTASGGTAPYTFSIDSGALPAGITLSSSGVLSGTTAATGTFNFTVHYGDSTTASTGGVAFGTQAMTLTVTAAPTIVVAPATLPAPTFNVPYSVSFSASGGTAPYTFSVSAGALPAGLTLTGGTLSGTPSATGSSSFTIRAVDANSFAGSRAYSVTVNGTVPGAPTIGSATGGNGQASVTFTAPTNTGGSAITGYTVTSSPGGVTGIGAGSPITVTGLTNGTAYSFTVTATNGTGTGSASAASNTVTPQTVPIAGPVSATVNYNSSANPITLNITGGTASSVAVATAASHGTATASGNTVSYTPTGSYAGSDNFTYTATNSAGTSAPATVTITIAAPTLALTPASSTLVGNYGQAFSQTFTASGGAAPYSYQATGTLPNGVTLNTQTGVLSGTPTQPGTYAITITAEDSSFGAGAPFSVQRSYTLTVNAAIIAVAPATLPVANVGVNYSAALTANGGIGPYSFAVTGGALPVGLALSSDGTLAGTPTAGGTFNFTATATDTHGQIGSRAYTVTATAPTIAVTPASLPGATATVAYSQTLSSVGGIAPYTYAVTSGAVPAGVTLASSGVLSGTPTAAGTFTFTVTSTDSSTGSGPYTGSRAYTFVVAAPSITITPATVPGGQAGTAYSQTFTATGGSGAHTFAMSGGALPAGLTLSTVGVLSGTPTVSGSFNVTLTATDGLGFTGSQAYTLAIGAPTVVVSASTTNATGQVGVPYSAQYSASGGTAPYAYAVTSGALPPGVVLSAAGALSGTPTAAGTFNFTITGTDSLGFTGARPSTLNVGQAVPVAVADTASTTSGTAVSIPVTTNDQGPITSIAIGQAPAHGTATVNGLAIVYTPTGTYFGSDTLTYTATGPGGMSSPATVTMTVAPLAVPVAAAQTATVLAGKSVTVHAATGATNGPFTAAAITTAPTSGTATVAGTDLVYTAPVDGSGSATLGFTLTNAYGTSQPATVTITVSPLPVAAPLTASTMAGQTVTVDVTSAARGGPFTGATVVNVSPAAAGSATVQSTASGYQIAFAAAPAFGGVATVSYTLSNAYATSAPGSIAIAVTNRPDPSKDAEVVGILNAQADSARRMATGQISNFQRRLESLHDGVIGEAFSNGITFSSASSRQSSDPMSVMRTQDNRSRYLVEPEGPSMGSSGTRAAGTLPGGIALWTGGAVNFGKSQAGASDNGIDFTTSGLSIGADKQISSTLAVGVGAGYGHDVSDIGQHTSRSTTDSVNGALYASWRPAMNVYLDALMGYQKLSFDARRYVTDNGNTVHGSRDGRQAFGSLALGYEHRSDDVLVSPYARLDAARANLDGYTEHGDDLFALKYQGQTVKTTTATLGFRAQWSNRRDYGVWTPQLRAEFGHDFQGSSLAAMRYADLLSGPLYRATLTNQSRNHTLVGFGLGLQTLKGWMIRAEYQALLDNTSRDNQSILLGVEKRFEP